MFRQGRNVDWKLLILSLFVWLAAVGPVQAQGEPPREIIWAQPQSGRWHDPNRWSPPIIPTSNDWVYVTNSGSFSVEILEDAACARLVLGGGPISGSQVQLKTTQGRFWVGESFVGDSSSTWIHGARIEGTGQIEVRGLFEWEQGVIATTGLAQIKRQGRMHIPPGPERRMEATVLENAGEIAVSEGVPINWVFAEGAQLVNSDSGVFKMGMARVITPSAVEAPATSGIQNQGFLETSAGAEIAVNCLNLGRITLSGPLMWRGGTNAGALVFQGCCDAALTIGPSSGDPNPFEFAEGTFFDGTTTNVGPRLNIDRSTIWRASSPHPGWLVIGNEPPEAGQKLITFQVVRDYQNTNSKTNALGAEPMGGITVRHGRIEIPPGRRVDTRYLYLRPSDLSDPVGVLNQATLQVEFLHQEHREIQNTGQLFVEEGVYAKAGGVFGVGELFLGPDTVNRFLGDTIPWSFVSQQVFDFGRTRFGGDIRFAAFANYTVDQDGELVFQDAVCLGREGTIVNNGRCSGWGTVEVPVLNSGYLNPDRGRFLKLSTFSQVEGETFLDGGSLGLDAASRLEFPGGTFLGTNQVVGTLRVGMNFVPGLPNGQLRVVGPLTIAPTTTYYLGLGGERPRFDFPTVQVEGRTFVSGILLVYLRDGFVPKPGMRFPFLKTETLAGRFNAVHCDGYSFDLEYQSTGVTLRAVTPVITLQPYSFSPDRGFVIRFSGDLSLNYEVQSSPDLLEWSRLGAPHISEGQFEFADPVFPGIPSRFYRVVPVP